MFLYLKEIVRNITQFHPRVVNVGMLKCRENSKAYNMLTMCYSSPSHPHPQCHQIRSGFEITALRHNILPNIKFH